MVGGSSAVSGTMRRSSRGERRIFEEMYLGRITNSVMRARRVYPRDRLWQSRGARADAHGTSSPGTLRMSHALARLAALALPLAVALLTGTAASAEPQRRALLVGVSDYPKEAVGDLQLAGPRNDVALMLDTLKVMGVPAENTIVLADGLEQTSAGRPADGMPTRKAIDDALATLAARSGPGDFVLIHLSGHGSQQPLVDASKHTVAKADGLEEIFLPIDIGPWEDSVGAVKNALVDHELGRAVAAIRAKGAMVWVVIDACHSGTMTRAGGGDIAKQVPPSVLRIPDAALAKARAAEETRRVKQAATRGRAGGARPNGPQWGFGALFGATGKAAVTPAAASSVPPSSAPAPTTAAPAAVSPTTASPTSGALPAPIASAPIGSPGKSVEPGGYVAFFAAWPDQVALQKALPRGYGAGERKPHGVLTFYLARALREGRASTFRDAAHEVMAGYDRFGQAPTPMFEGDLSAPLPGGASGARLRWPVTAEGGRFTIGGGVVDGLAVGAVIGLAPIEAPDAPKGFARIVEAGPARAVAEPIERGGIAFDPALARENLLASLVERSADFRLAVARPADLGSGATAEALAAALTTLEGESATGPRLVAASEPADLRLVVSGGRLWLVSEGTELKTTGREESPSIPLAASAGETTTALRRALTGFSKARNLVRVAGLVGAGPVSSALSVEAFVARDEGATPAGALAADDRACPALSLDRLPESARPIEGEGLDLGHCDALYFRLSNSGAKPIDVTPLYIDGVGGIAYMGPPEGLRLEPGVAGRLVPLRIVTWSQKRKAPLPIGRERLLFVAVEVEGRTALPADFRYLAQAAPTTSATRGGAAPGTFRGLMEAAAFGGATRSSSAPANLGAAGILDFGWRVVAPEGEK